MHRAILLVILLAGCSFPGDERAEHCGEVQRARDGAWFPVASASSGLPAWEARATSAVWAAWEAEYDGSTCGMAVALGEPAPWYGPILHVGERDAVDVVLLNHTDANVIGGVWRLHLNVTGPLRATPEAWEGEVYETAYVGCVVEALAEGRGNVRVNATLPGGAEMFVRNIEYVVRDGVEGAPHRVELHRTL